MDREGIFAGDEPVALVRAWLDAARGTEPEDANAIALATADADGLPNVRMVLLKEIEAPGEGPPPDTGGFVFYTNYASAKGRELAASGQAAFVLHWKSLRRQIRVRGPVEMEDGPQADAYYASRATDSRLGAWASLQSRPLPDRDTLIRRLEAARETHGAEPARPDDWGGLRLRPTEIEFWADGQNRLHDRFRWRRPGLTSPWDVTRLYP